VFVLGTGLILLVLALVYAVFHTLFSIEGNRRWARVEPKLKELQAEADARNLERPILRGTVVPGDGWDEYQLGLKAIAPIRNFYLLNDFLGGRNNVDPGKVGAILTAHGAAVDHLRRGVMRGHGRFPFLWDDDSDHHTKSAECANLATLAICKSRFLAGSGRLQESVELLLDTCQFARDLGCNGTVSIEINSIFSLRKSFHDLRDLIVSRRLSRDQLLQIERELKVIDDSFPRTSHALMNDTLRKGLFLLKLDQRRGGMSGMSRRMFAKDLELAFEVMKLYKDLDDLSWRELQLRDIDIERMRENLGGSGPRLEPLLFSDRLTRIGRTELRLVRVAARYLATGEVLDLDDPFGTKLLTVVTGKKLQIRSEGYSTTTKLPPKETDIVLEVER
jgi:hypothetical protein